MKNKVKVFKYPNGATIIYSKSSSRFTDYQVLVLQIIKSVIK